MNFSLRVNSTLVAILLTVICGGAISQAQLKLPFRTQRDASMGTA